MNTVGDIGSPCLG